MKPLVIDASVAVKWFIPEAGSIAAVKLLDDRKQLIAPDLIYPEVGNIFWKLCGRRLLTDDEAFEIANSFLALPLEIYNSRILLAGALEIAAATGRTVYDSLYLALAVENDCVMVTADKQLANALKNTDFARFIK